MADSDFAVVMRYQRCALLSFFSFDEGESDLTLSAQHKMFGADLTPGSGGAALTGAYCGGVLERHMSNVRTNYKAAH